MAASMPKETFLMKVGVLRRHDFSDEEILTLFQWKL